MGRKDANKAPFRYQSISRLPDEIKGVYAIWFKKTGKCLYVGQAQKQPLKVRLKQELTGSHNRKLKMWLMAYGEDIEFCYNIAAVGKIDRFETRLIKKLAPETNILKQRK